MTITTTYERDRNGAANANTRIDTGLVDQQGVDIKGPRRLDISTFKGARGGLVTTATVCTVSEGYTTHAIGFGACGDYSKRLAEDRGARCTEKNVRAQHDRCIVEAATILADAVAWYAAGRNIRQ